MLQIKKQCTIEENLNRLIKHCETLQIDEEEILLLFQFYYNFPDVLDSLERFEGFDHLKAAYKNHRRYIVENILKSVEINYRVNDSFFLCPYCSDKLDLPIEMTLDHFRPKHSHPEYSLFSKNLIPSCHQCNSKFKKDKINSQKIDIFYPISSLSFTDKFKLIAKLELDRVSSDTRKKLYFKLKPIAPNPLVDSLIKELELEKRINKRISTKIYRFMKNLKAIDFNNQKSFLEELKADYLEEGEISLFLLAESVLDQNNLNYLRNKNYFI